MEVPAPRSVLVVHPPKAHTFFTTGFGAAMPSKQAPRPCRRCRAGVQRRQTASSSRLQGDVPKANQQEIPSFLLPALSFFFFHSDRSPISRFQAFAKHESQLLACFCLVSHSGSRVLLNQWCSANNHAKHTRYILSKEKLFTKMCSPRVTCTSSSNHTGIKLIYNIPSVGSPSCIFLWEELSSGLELGFYVPS